MLGNSEIAIIDLDFKGIQVTSSSQQSEVNNMYR